MLGRYPLPDRAAYKRYTSALQSPEKMLDLLLHFFRASHGLGNLRSQNLAKFLAQSVDGGSQPRWRGDGGELFYVAPDLKLMSVEVRPGTSFDYGMAKPLFQTRIDTYTGPNRYVVDRSGQKFLINIPIDEQIARPITVTVHPFD